MLGIVFCACSQKITRPLTSTLHTEGLHHLWQVTKMANEHSQFYAFIDLRNVARSGASAGCDSLSFTPKYGYNNRIDLMHVHVEQSRCKGTTLLDKTFADHLKNIFTYRLAGDKVSFFNKAGAVLFDAVIDPLDENGSIERNWKITSLINIKAAALEPLNPYIDLQNLQNGIAKLGCNTFDIQALKTGSYHIAIKGLGSTRMYCKNAAMVEEVFAKTLPLVNMYQVVGTTMKLFDKNGTLLLEAVALH